MIHCEGLSFRYGRRRPPIFDELDLSIGTGRTILLGPNGAGKSTLIGLIATVLRPDRGTIRIGDETAARRGSTDDVRRRVAWMPQTIRPAAGLSVRQQVALSGWLAGMQQPAAWTAAGDVLSRVDLDALASTKATRLSGGQRARMGLAQALVHGAEVLLLDEPTAALDPDQKQRFLDLLGEVADDRTVVVSSHDISDLANSFDHVVVMSAGRVRFRGPVAEFLTPSGTPTDPVAAYRARLGAET